jgi:hypothetical protein
MGQNFDRPSVSGVAASPRARFGENWIEAQVAHGRVQLR